MNRIRRIVVFAAAAIVLAAPSGAGFAAGHSSPSDHEQIRAVLALYAKALDRRDYAALKQVFTPDAVGVYTGVTYDGLEAITGLMVRALTQCAATQHLLGSQDIQLDGDRATASTYLQAIHVGKNPGFEGRLMTYYGEYVDRLVRTKDGWRIARRELRPMHIEGDIGIK
jgi:uncharacterized protein (TIGR02246 family)